MGDACVNSLPTLAFDFAPNERLASEANFYGVLSKTRCFS